MSESPNCPVCEEPVEGPDSNDSFPFCSSHCKEIDLGRWFDEQYTIPITPQRTERRIPKNDDRSETDD